MATVINTEKKEFQKSNISKKEGKKKTPLFRKMNYILMGIGIVILVLGYILLSGGNVDGNDVFNSEIFNTRRLVVAPTLLLLGLVVEIFAIMYYPRTKQETNTED